METKPTNQIAVDFTETTLLKFNKLNEISGSWHKSIDLLKLTIFKFSLAYLRSERIEGESVTYRHDTSFYLWVLFCFFTDMEEYYDSSQERRREIFLSAIKGNSSIGVYSKDIRQTITDIFLDYLRDVQFVNETKQKRETSSFIIDVIISVLRNFPSNAYELFNEEN